MFNKETFFRDIERPLEEEEWKGSDSEMLASLLSNQVMIKILRVVNEAHTKTLEGFTSLDLTRAEDVGRGCRLQGEGQGILNVLQILADFAAGEQEDERERTDDRADS